MLRIAAITKFEEHQPDRWRDADMLWHSADLLPRWHNLTNWKEIIIGSLTGKNTYEIYLKYLNLFYFTINL